MVARITIETKLYYLNCTQRHIKITGSNEVGFSPLFQVIIQCRWDVSAPGSPHRHQGSSASLSLVLSYVFWSSPIRGSKVVETPGQKLLRESSRDSPCGPVVKNLLSVQGNQFSIPWLGNLRSHATGQLSPCTASKRTPTHWNKYLYSPEKSREGTDSIYPHHTELEFRATPSFKDFWKMWFLLNFTGLSRERDRTKTGQQPAISHSLLL